MCGFLEARVPFQNVHYSRPASDLRGTGIWRREISICRTEMKGEGRREKGEGRRRRRGRGRGRREEG